MNHHLDRLRSLFDEVFPCMIELPGNRVAIMNAYMRETAAPLRVAANRFDELAHFVACAELTIRVDGRESFAAELTFHPSEFGGSLETRLTKLPPEEDCDVIRRGVTELLAIAATLEADVVEVEISPAQRVIAKVLQQAGFQRAPFQTPKMEIWRYPFF